ncbi:MAG: metallophosphoesterase [Planctomycetota bacterium]|jgi:putative phosphoesterase
MLVGIVADSHDNLYATKGAVDVLVARKVEVILHGGDIIAPFTAKAFLEAAVPVEAVFGNNDGETSMLSELLPGIARGARTLDLDGRKVLLVHDRADLSEEQASGADMVVFGHNHHPELREVGGRIELNPGEVCGWLTGRHTLAVWDSGGGLPEFVEFEERR